MLLSDYVMVLRRRWWVIVIAAAAAAIGAYLFSKYVQERVWRSEATYLVIPSRYDNGLSIVLRDSMNSYRDMALAPIQIEQIGGWLRLDRDADWLLQHIQIQPRPEDRRMVVQVDYPDPKTAQDLANAVGENMVALVSALPIEGTDRISLRVLQPARPAFLFRPQTKINVAAGGLLGLVLGVLLAFLLEVLDDSLKTPQDVERFVGLTTLGAIPTVSD